MEMLTERLDKARGCLAHLKVASRGSRRRRLDDEDLVVSGTDPYAIDAEQKVAPSKSFRRLFDKTQVITAHSNAHVRRRASHTLEVSAIASTIADILGLNQNLARAISLGHDIGHAPLGHAGESFIGKAIGREFRHETMSVVVAQHVERRGRGLNLTHATLSGIWHHSRTRKDLKVTDDMSQEAAVVMFADKIAYTTGDVSDCKRLGVPLNEEILRLLATLGETQRGQVNRIMAELCIESSEAGRVSFAEMPAAKTFARVRELMYEVYPRLNIHGSEELLRKIHDFIGHALPKTVDPTIVLALMTDHDVLSLAREGVLDITCLMRTSVWELLPILEAKKIDISEADLDW